MLKEPQPNPRRSKCALTGLFYRHDNDNMTHIDFSNLIRNRFALRFIIYLLYIRFLSHFAIINNCLCPSSYDSIGQRKYIRRTGIGIHHTARSRQPTEQRLCTCRSKFVRTKSQSRDPITHDHRSMNLAIRTSVHYFPNAASLLPEPNLAAPLLSVHDHRLYTHGFKHVRSPRWIADIRLSDHPVCFRVKHEECCAHGFLACDACPFT
mmetsp:Transcript_10229/g.18598  ORF Transcript_10229/g.18598 Transcript_10229/m.18598 type:complete len:208 (-) Transcript_10229:143-766(-)